MAKDNEDNLDNPEKRKRHSSKKHLAKVGYRINRESPKAEQGASLVARAPIDFSESFMAKLQAAFIASAWRIQREKNILTISSLNLSPPKQILIKNTKDGMVFSGNANSEKEIVLAANAYQAACLEEGEKVRFEVDADNENAAVKFIEKLKNEGFDITKIRAINCKGMDLSEKSMKDYTAQMIANIQAPNTPILTAKSPLKPKPPGTVS